MGDVGKKYCLMRLGQCPDSQSLERVWGSISPSFQRDVDIYSLKEQMKQQFSDEKLCPR